MQFLASKSSKLDVSFIKMCSGDIIDEGVLPPNLLKSWNRNIGCSIGRAAAEVPIKFQSDQNI